MQMTNVKESSVQLKISRHHVTCSRALTIHLVVTELVLLLFLVQREIALPADVHAVSVVKEAAQVRRGEALPLVQRHRACAKRESSGQFCHESACNTEFFTSETSTAIKSKVGVSAGEYGPLLHHPTPWRTRTFHGFHDLEFLWEAEGEAGVAGEARQVRQRRRRPRRHDGVGRRTLRRRRLAVVPAENTTTDEQRTSTSRHGRRTQK